VYYISLFRFLESLKQDALAASEMLNRKLLADEQRGSGGAQREYANTPNRDFTARKVHYQSRYLDSSSESDTDDFNKSAPHRKRNTFFQHLQKEKQQHGVSSSTAPRPAKKKPDPPSARRVVKKLSSSTRASRDTPGHATPIPIKSVKNKINRRSTPRSATPSNSLSSSLDTGRRRGGSGAGAGAGAGRGSLTKRAVVPNSSLRVSQSSEGDAIAAFNLTKQAEEKNDTLKLRLQGQLNSIRVLETQLAEAQHSIAVRDLELANTLRRVTQLESREREREKPERREGGEGGGGRRGAQRDESSKTYQVQTELIALQARFNDERSRRSRTEERLRIIKEYCDKQKTRLAEVEEKNEELEGVLKALHEKLQKKKIEVKSSSRDISHARVKVVEKDSELQTCKNQLLRAERSAKDLRRDNDRLKEELRLLRREASVSEDKSRRSALEIEVLRERQSATKLAYRLQNQNQSLSQSSSHVQSKSHERARSQSCGRRSAPSSLQAGSHPADSSSNSSTDKPEVVVKRSCPYSKPRSRSLSRAHAGGTKSGRSYNEHEHGSGRGKIGLVSHSVEYVEVLYCLYILSRIKTQHMDKTYLV
jgi:DNA repair exonuclease SbcCD ATPase subunit